MSQLDDILQQAFTDGASDTMWQSDRHVEIYATAKQALKALMLGLVEKQTVELCYYDQEDEEHKKRGVLIPVNELRTKIEAL